jgi:accessory gene regulator B
MIFAGSDSEMISKLAKNVAHFFVMVMLVFSYGICNISEQIAQIFSIGFITIALPIIFCIAPVPHPNKPMSEEKGVKLRKRSIILAVALSAAVIALLVFQYRKISLYVSSGILLSAIMALLGRFLNRGDNSKR